MIDASTLAVGNGYSTADLPYKMEIHNGFLASVFHFGFMGLISQCLLIAFFVGKLRNTAPRAVKGILLGCIVVFAFAYLSGPPQARPSLWAPLLFLGAFLGAPRRTTSAPPLTRCRRHGTDRSEAHRSWRRTSRRRTYTPGVLSRPLDLQPCRICSQGTQRPSVVRHVARSILLPHVYRFDGVRFTCAGS
jgi:hypothetical protein